MEKLSDFSPQLLKSFKRDRSKNCSTKTKGGGVIDISAQKAETQRTPSTPVFPNPVSE